ncbi:type II secretion system F family protein [Vibrio mangrovi]|uniref:Bacterial type II secretion system protein F domain protein n=1 Tax=Vibrio mangrovi TaxID=474394 RepID=A0A1Y6IYK5_9VIBR|nr:type II secretion system F family protein [Vibrio mangrovi]MDW6002346.1 type II secretion system F family protein [Vibrio mangrovi]SMS02755.1 Bacterial type II secretion system protein F domain protein [Vibrio mangrovi]
MDTITYILNFRPDEEFFVLAIVFVASTLLIITVALVVMGSKSQVKRQLEEIRKDMGSGSLKKSRKLDLEYLAPIVAPRNKRDQETARHQLMHAGFHDANALTIYYGLKVFSTIIGLLIASSFYLFTPDISHLNLLIIVSVAAGIYIPNVVLNHFVKKRQRKIRAGVPDALDLLVVCTESGLGFSSSLRRVADELMISHPDFADELDTVCAKIKAGVEMVDAFEDLVERTGVTEILGLVHMLAHASRIGGSLAQTLREYTEDYRDRRNQEVEEIAAKIPTKMIFPLLLFIWPCFFIVAIGPSILALTATLGK